MLQRFILKIEFHFVTVIFALFRLQSNNVEEHFDSAFGNRFGLMRFRKLYFVSSKVYIREMIYLLENILELLNEKHLVDVNFRPLVHDCLHYI